MTLFEWGRQERLRQDIAGWERIARAHPGNRMIKRAIRSARKRMAEGDY